MKTRDHIVLPSRNMTSETHCRVCGTHRWTGEIWHDLCPDCARWAEIGRHLAAAVRLLREVAR